MVQGVLEGEEIPSWIRRNVIPGYDGIRGSWYQPHWGEVLVPQEIAPQAERLIQKYLSGIPYDNDDENDDDVEDS